MKNYIISASIAASFAFAGPAVAQTKPAIAVIVKDTTSVYWQTVLAGARKAGLISGSTCSRSARSPNPTRSADRHP